MRNFSYGVAIFMGLLVFITITGPVSIIMLGVFALFAIVPIFFPDFYDKYNYWPGIKAPDGEIYSRERYCRLRLIRNPEWPDYFPEITKRIQEEENIKLGDYAYWDIKDESEIE